jgi:hypothetical protein
MQHYSSDRSGGRRATTRRQWLWGAGTAVLAVVTTLAAWTYLNRSSCQVGGAAPDQTLSRPVDLLELAPRAQWTSAAGPLQWDDFDRRTQGLAQTLDHQRTEDGTINRALKTHPNFDRGGYIEGLFTLPRAIEKGDHFITYLGFYVDQPSCQVGLAQFSAYVVTGVSASAQILRVDDSAADGKIHREDVDLSRYAGAKAIQLRVNSGETTTCDWAAWWDTRLAIEESAR